MSYRLSENGRKLIQHYEGLKLEAYICPAGVPTIGYGHTRNVKIGDKIDKDQAEKLFNDDIITTEGLVNDLHLRITQCQFDALVSFVYNIGIGAFKGSTLFKKIKLYPKDPEIRFQFSRWNKATNEKGELVELQGLTNRRYSEAELYLTGNLELL